MLHCAYYSQPPGYPEFNGYRLFAMFRLPELPPAFEAELRLKLARLRTPTAKPAPDYTLPWGSTPSEIDWTTQRFQQKWGVTPFDVRNAESPLRGRLGAPATDTHVTTAIQFATVPMLRAGMGRRIEPTMRNLELPDAPRRVKTEAVAAPQTRPAMREAADRDLGEKNHRAKLVAFNDVGRTPAEITPEEEVYQFYLKSGTPSVKDLTLRKRLAFVGSDKGSVLHGPEKSVVQCIVSYKSADEVRDSGTLVFDENTRLWADLEQARAEGTKMYNEEFPAKEGATGTPRLPTIYSVIAPANLISDAVERREFPVELLRGAMWVVDRHGALFHETWTNPNAKYDLNPGEPYSEPVRTGMPAKQVLRSAARAAAVISASATAAYTLRWSLAGGGDILTTDWPQLINAGRGMFGYRATVNAAVWITQMRLAQRLATLAEIKSPASLEIVAQQLRGWRATLRGIPRNDQHVYEAPVQILRNNPEEFDPASLTVLDSGSDKVMSPNSLAGRVLEGLRILSYGVTDAGNARIWAPFLHPFVAMFKFSPDSSGASNLATDLFAPVHPATNGAEIMQRSLAAKARQQNLSQMAQVEGARRRGDYQGTDHLHPFVRTLIGLGDGASVTHPGLHPLGFRIQKPPFIYRLKEHAMAAATLISAGPFAGADGLNALHAFASGRPGAGFVELGMVAADAIFARGYRDGYLDLYRANRGMGPNVRKSLIPWLNEPLKGAERFPSDITKRRLLDDKDGVLAGFSPKILVAVGMDTQFVLGLFFASNEGPASHLAGTQVPSQNATAWTGQSASSTQLSEPLVAADTSVPLALATPRPEPESGYGKLFYTVRSGDTLTSIARQHESTLLTAQQKDLDLDDLSRDSIALARMIEINPRLAPDPNRLEPGQLLICGYANTTGDQLAWPAPV